MPEKKKTFSMTLTGLLTGLAALITAGTGAYIAINDDNQSQPATDKPIAKGTENPKETTPLEDQQKISVPKSSLQERFRLEAIIDDPDGYTNVRSSQSSLSQIVATVHEQEEFFTFTQDGDWWQVLTKNGKVGYMHVSRIKLVQ